VVQALEWNPGDLVFVPQMDADHQQLFADLEKVRQAMDAGTATSQLGFHAWRLSKSLAIHCTAEERLMTRSRYPGFDWHERQHHAGRKKMARLIGAIQVNDRQRVEEAFREVTQWFQDHVRLADRMLAAHLRNDSRARLVS